MKYTSKYHLYKDVWDAMDACNSSGLIYSLPDIVEGIREYDKLAGALINKHPIIILMADKLLQLAGVFNNTPEVDRAYSTVHNVVIESENNENKES